MRSIQIVVLAGVAALIAAGCASNKPEEKPAPVVESKPAPPPPATPPPAPAPVAKVEMPAPAPMDPLMDPNGILAKRSVYFDFDRSMIKTEYVPLIEAHGRYLVDHNARAIRIEGNCDERGGREYNLALGQRRADAVRERMQALGVQGGRIETISFGKEKPKATSHDEVAWAENRRDDIVYK
jgi:peptidoglycan-associated lipoprotein